MVFAADSQGWITVTSPGAGSVTISAHTKEKEKGGKKTIGASPIKIVFVNNAGNIITVDASGRARIWTE